MNTDQSRPANPKPQASSPKPFPAVFLDRDNTLVHDPGYIRLPGQVRLMPGAAAALRKLHAAGFKLVVVSNQSGVARGIFTEVELAAVNDRLRELLAAEAVTLDGLYYCPFFGGPEAVVEAYRRDSELRKPRPGMLLLAAAEMNLDLPRSWMIGDGERDVEAGRAAGCGTVRIGYNQTDLNTAADYVAADLPDAAGYIVQNHAD